ncbi:hypothetical protein CBER1_03189 [Cercospora berteroae]|uniref:Apple domain-containing protein n=1 Tax=Cercospora berteroae TaxID=357750 RepID=A0A2S6CL82_9PEZI|nr:hypothetical protein CBER1_03189 [Cercospora berteroae]
MQLLVLLTAALGSVALAQQPTSSTVNFVCATRYALQPTSQIRTTTFRVSTTNTAGRTVTVNPRTTRTIGANTFTVTNTFTSFSTVTAAGSVATATAFVTATSTQVSTVTQTFTSATVITVTNSLAGVTSTVAAPAGFTALGLTPGFVEKRDSAPEPHHPHIARAAAKGHLPILPEVGKKQLQARQNSGQEFPVGILCTSRTTFFVTGTATTTRAGPTTTITITQPNVVRTVTTTITGAPRTVTPAGTTRFITVTSTTLRSATTTSTTVLVNTNTVNINGPAATAFAQCAPENLISSAFFGNQIGTVTINSAFTVRSINVTDITGLECCTACARLPTCAGFAQQSALQGGSCFQILNNGVESGLGYTVGNAQCGQLGAIAGPPNDGNS